MEHFSDDELRIRFCGRWIADLKGTRAEIGIWILIIVPWCLLFGLFMSAEIKG